ncbi:hypothetical protein BB561_005539 [Smittium simulii]|uniref:Conserved oligomeric Golgi complex subunit 7 n=1 Tax=Smittium simulii TaxID=133385 RepID=A0A2T9Y9T6_9FUNG|nr:hypothetical protein BB561_005539 [Smittium simulii]
MEVNIHDFENENFDSTSWINSYFEKCNVKVETLANQIDTSTILFNQKDATKQDLQNDNPELFLKVSQNSIIDSTQELTELEKETTELTKKLHLLASEEQNSQDRIRIRLEKTVSYLNRDLDRLKFSLKNADTVIGRFEPKMQHYDTKTQDSLLEIAKIQLYRHRLYETQSVLSKIEKLTDLHITIEKLETEGELIIAFNKLDEGVNSIVQLNLLSELNLNSNLSIKTDLFETSSEKFEENIISKVKNFNEADFNNALKDLLEKYKSKQQELLIKLKEKLNDSLAQKNIEDCKVWIDFFQSSGNSELPRSSYIEKTGIMLTEIWDNSYNEVFSNKNDNNQVLDLNISEPYIRLKRFNKLLAEFFENLKNILHNEMEFCDNIGIQYHQSLIKEILELICERVGSKITENLIVLKQKDVSNIDEVLDQLINLYKIVTNFVLLSSQQFEDSFVLSGVGETENKVNDYHTSVKTDINFAYAYLLNPFIIIQNAYINCENQFLNSELEKNILQYILSNMEKEKNSSETVDLKNEHNEELIIKRIKRAQDQLNSLGENIIKHCFDCLKKSNNRSSILNHGFSTFNFMKIFDKYINELLDAYFKKILNTFKEYFICIPEKIEKWIENQDKSPLDQNINVVSESALWWSQIDLILVCISNLLLTLQKSLNFVVESITGMEKYLHSVYEFDSKEDKLVLKDAISIIQKPIVASPINSNQLVEMITSVNRILNSNEFDHQAREPNSIENFTAHINFIPNGGQINSINGKRLNNSHKSRLVCLLLPKTIEFLIDKSLSNLQNSMLTVLFGSQLEALKKIPTLNLWYKNQSNSGKSITKSSELDDYNKTNKKNSNELSTKILKIPQFSFSPSSNIRIVGEQILSLPMVLEQIELKNIIEVNANDLYNDKKNSSNDQYIKAALTGKNIISLPLIFIEFSSPNYNIENILNLMIGSEQTDDLAATRTWLLAISNTTLDVFIHYFNKIVKPLSENGKGQMKADMDYLQSIFMAMDIHLQEKFTSLKLD